MDISILYFNSMKMWRFLDSSGMWVWRGWAMGEKVIMFPYGRVTDIEYFSVLMIFWHHCLKQSNCLVHPELDIVWCRV